MVSTPRTKKGTPATRPWAAEGWAGDCLLASPAFKALAEFQGKKMEAAMDAAFTEQENDPEFASFFIHQHPELSGDFRRLQKGAFRAI